MGAAVRLLILLAALACAACGDPIVVLGDAPGIARVIAGIGDSVGSRVDSLATRSRFTEPAAVAFDETTRRLLIGDRGATLTQSGITRPVGRLFAVRSDGRLSLLIDRGGCVAGACLEAPHSIAVAPDGSLFITDRAGHRIFRLRPGAQALDVVAGDGVPGSAPDGAVAAAARVAAPTGIVWADGRLIFAERSGNRVRSIEPDGRLGGVAGTGEYGFAGDGGPANGARMAAPEGLAVSGNRLFIADRENNRVRVVDLAAGTIATIAGAGPAGFGGDGGRAVDAALDRPAALAVGPGASFLFVADQANNRVRAIDLARGSIVTFAGTGAAAFSPGPRPAGDVSLLRPAGAAIAEAGFLFFTDPGHAVVWRATLRF